MTTPLTRTKNLAQTLSDQGRNADALLLIDSALQLRGPFESEVRATRQLILGRMAQQISGHRLLQDPAASRSGLFHPGSASLH